MKSKTKVKTPVVTVTPPSKSTKLNNDTSNVIITSTSKTKKHIDVDSMEKKTSLAGKMKLIVFTYLKVIVLLLNEKLKSQVFYYLLVDNTFIRSRVEFPGVTCLNWVSWQVCIHQIF